MPIEDDKLGIQKEDDNKQIINVTVTHSGHMFARAQTQDEEGRQEGVYLEAEVFLFANTPGGAKCIGSALLKFDRAQYADYLLKHVAQLVTPKAAKLEEQRKAQPAKSKLISASGLNASALRAINGSKIH